MENDCIIKQVGRPGAKRLFVLAKFLPGQARRNSMANQVKQGGVEWQLMVNSKVELNEILYFFSFPKLDRRTRTPKWNWMRCEKNWQLMSFFIALNILSFYTSF
ncbi:unnamed protein product [Prunus brigantina]